MSRLKRWVGAAARKLRGILGLSLIGGGIAALGGSVITALAIVIDIGMPLSRDMPGVLAGVLGELSVVYFALGAVTTGAFATLLSVTGRRLTLSELSVPRAALTGGFIAMAIPTLMIAYSAGLSYAIDMSLQGLPVWLSLGAAGAGISGGLVAMAKRAERLELNAADEAIAQIE